MAWSGSCSRIKAASPTTPTAFTRSITAARRHSIKLVRSYAARHAGDLRALVLTAPGWIRTQLDGPKAPFGVDDSMPLIVDVLFVRQGKPGLAFLDRDGNTVLW